MLQFRQNCGRQTRHPFPSQPPLYFHLELSPHLSFSFLSSSRSFHHMKWGGRALSAISTNQPLPSFHPPLGFSSFAHQVQREPLKQHLAPKHPHTSAEFLFTPLLIHQHTFIFFAPHFKHMKGCSAGTAAKGKVGGGGKEKGNWGGGGI